MSISDAERSFQQFSSHPKNPLDYSQQWELIRKRTNRIQVFFDLPFLVAVNDTFSCGIISEYIKAKDAGEEFKHQYHYLPLVTPESLEKSGFKGTKLLALQVSDLGKHVKHGVYVPHDIKKPYRIATNDSGSFVYMGFVPRINQAQDPVMIGFPRGDIAGRVMYSSVFVELFPAYFNEYVKLAIENDSSKHYMHIRDNFNEKGGGVSREFNSGDVYIKTAIYAVNRFIEQYKILNDSYFITNVTENMCSPYRIAWRDAQNIVLSELTVPKLTISDYDENKLPDEEDRILRSELSKISSPDILDTLDINIRQRLELQEWKIAIIESAVLFESWVQPRIRYMALGVKKMSRKSFDRLMKFKDADNNSHPKPMSMILDSVVLELTGVEFVNTDVYKELKQNALTPRNLIVHGSKFTANSIEATNAYLSVRKAIDYLDDILSMPN
ncbi:hypothetical protein LJ737_19995 [Hymenobacter sp. 15J16-1T3B]|uniref:hypothetical protein n=1 Tax=Hymenobacter sp. 15J16-1T3B TaxID=2886941 RepID=UPI001D1085A1|nr:hypothetical protein [Hymenobacter sp. 15J16-1T3B]MCC3159535.1 hypothetical protein [Hymenobacter sp. 15J16-1T3B]